MAASEDRRKMARRTEAGGHDSVFARLRGEGEDSLECWWECCSLVEVFGSFSLDCCSLVENLEALSLEVVLSLLEDCFFDLMEVRLEGLVEEDLMEDLRLRELCREGQGLATTMSVWNVFFFFWLLRNI